MPFGKHKDKEMAEIPKDYLRWLHSQKWLRPDLATAVAEALGENASESAAPRKPWQPSEGEPVPW